MNDPSNNPPRETWCRSLPDRSLTTLREAAESLTIEQLRPHGYDYCFLNLLTIFGSRYSAERLSTIAVRCLRNYLFSGEEFHSYCLAARGKRPWNGEMQALNAAIHLTDRAKMVLSDLLANGSVIACGYHWGAFRFIPLGLSSLGFPVNSILSTTVSDKYSSYSSFNGVEMAEARARGVSEAFYGVKVIDTNRQPELLNCVRSLKRTPGLLFVPVDGMFTPRLGHHSVEISVAGYPLQVKSNPATLAARLQVPLVAVFATRENPDSIAIDVADVIEPDPEKTFAQAAMQRLYASLENRIRQHAEQWEGARTFHHLRTVPGSKLRATPSAEDLSTVRAGIEKDQLLFHQSRVASMQLPDGTVAWVDCQTLRCFGRTPDTRKMLTAIQNRADAANLWKEYARDEARGRSLIHFLGQLRAEGLLTVECDAASTHV
jgi:hypothetical protein